MLKIADLSSSTEKCFPEIGTGPVITSSTVVRPGMSTSARGPGLEPDSVVGAAFVLLENQYLIGHIAHAP
jgi:hypothetical protein